MCVAGAHTISNWLLALSTWPRCFNATAPRCDWALNCANTDLCLTNGKNDVRTVEQSIKRRYDRAIE